MKARLTTAALLAGCMAFGLSAPAKAFCRTTTCDPKDASQGCELDAERCVLSGLPLYWPGACVSFSINRDGTALRGLDWETTEALVAQGFNAWMSADCGGGSTPSISLSSRSPVACDAQEYNQRQPNANIWTYRDGGWPYSGSDATLALTTITFNTRTGEIFDADVEINSAENVLTTSDTEIRADMLSIITHEAGHFLGLSHTTNDDSTMFAQYIPGTVSLRDLTPDDQAGICAVYPPGRDADTCSLDPRHGFSGSCASDDDDASCSCALPGSSTRGGLGLLALGFGVALLGLRRRSAAPKAGRSPGR